MKQSETIEHLPKVSAQPYTLSLRFSPSWLPLSLPIPLPRWGVGGTRITTGTLYILSNQGRLTLHVRILVHISQVSGVFLKSQCQCSCIDTLTKLLVPCPYGKCFKRCWRYISLCGFVITISFSTDWGHPVHTARDVLLLLKNMNADLAKKRK